jgi:DNA-binding LacI/PurR family transcriptional regulator
MKSNISKNPTMKDIARIARVSQATVSYVLNNSAGISQKVRERVLEIADDLGYIPNAIARNLKNKTSNTIGIIVPDVMNSYYNEMINYVEKMTREQGLFSFVCNTMHDPKIEEWYIVNSIQQKIAGIIICYGLTNRECYKKLDQHGIPFVILDDLSEDEKNSCIIMNNIKGSFLAIRHLIKLGIRDIAYCSQALYNIALRERYKGFRLAMEEAGLSVSEEMIYISKEHKDYDKIRLGYTATEKILSKGFPSGIFAATDHIAFGVIKKLNDLNIRIPEDISVIGYDDVPLSGIISPSLTTISQPIKKMCKLGAVTLFSEINNEGYKANNIMLEPKIIIRESAPDPLTYQKGGFQEKNKGFRKSVI